MEKSPTGDNDSKARALWGIVVFVAILAVVAGAFSAAVWGGFLTWDDPDWVTGNCRLQQPSIKTLLWLFIPGLGEDYQPLTFASLMIDRAFSGNDPFIYHLHNLVLYILGACLLYAFLVRLFDGLGTFEPSSRRSAALISTLLFLIHPAHVESVAWVTERKDMLAFVFGTALLHTVAGVSVRRERKPLKSRAWLLAWLLFLAMILSKGYAAVFAAAVWLLDFTISRRKGKVPLKLHLAHLPFFILAATAVVFYSKINRIMFSIQDDFAVFGLFQRISLFCRFTGDYILSMLWPFDLGYMHELGPEMALFGGKALFGLAASLVCLAAILWAWKKGKNFALFLLGFAVINILPGTGIIPIPYANRYLFFPVLSQAVLIVWLSFEIGKWLADHAKGAILPRLHLVLLLIFGLVFAAESHSRIPVWRSDSAFYLDALRHNPGNDNLSLHAASALIGENPELGLKILAPVLEKEYAKKLRKVRGTEAELINRLLGPDAALEAMAKAIGETGPIPSLCLQAADYALAAGDESARENWLAKAVSRLPAVEARKKLCDFWLGHAKKAINSGRYAEANGFLGRCPDVEEDPEGVILSIVGKAGAEGGFKSVAERLAKIDPDYRSAPLYWQTLYFTYRLLKSENEAAKAKEKWKRAEEELAIDRCWFRPSDETPRAGGREAFNP